MAISLGLVVLTYPRQFHFNERVFMYHFKNRIYKSKLIEYIPGFSEPWHIYASGLYFKTLNEAKKFINEGIKNEK